MVFSAYLHRSGRYRSGQSVARVREGFLSRFFLSRFLGCGLRGLVAASVLALLAPVCLADSNNPITLDTNETLFAVLTAMNTCGYNVNLNISDAKRLNIRAEVQRNLAASNDAQTAMATMCEWYLAHKRKDTAHDLSQNMSLALYL